MQNSFPTSRGARLALVAITLIVLALAGCNREQREDTRDAEEIYADAREALQNRQYETAIDLYGNLTTRFPFGRHAEQAQLDMAYAQLKAREYERALTTLDRFTRTYPTHPNVDYAWYLKGLVHYEESMGMLRRMFPSHVVDRDQQSAHSAFREFRELVERFPQSRYIADARQRMVFLRNALAEHEITIGEYYFRRGAHVAALNRARYVIENYPRAPANVEALDLMARAYGELDLGQLAADTRQVLESNYGDLDLHQDEPGLWRRLWPFD